MARQKILIIEDDMDIQVFAKTLLEGAGFTVEACGTEQDGLRRFEEMRPDLVVIDIGLPDGSGLEVCVAIRAGSKEKVPVIFATARGDLQTRLKGFGAGAQDYIHKPFAFQELLARVKVHLDIKKSQEELVERAYNLELVNRARQDLVDMIVHDLKMPLSSIKGTLELIQARGLITAGDYKTLVSHAGTTADFMLLMLNDLLDIGLAQQKGLEPQNAPIDSEGMLQKLTTLFAVRSGRTNVKIKTTVDSSAANYQSDFNLVFRILVNLISNALSASRAGNEVEIQCRRAGEKVRLSVADRGPGVPDSDKTAIFEKYKTTKPKSGLGDAGSGIGLSFCKLAAEAMKGKIWVEDRPGGGSVFILELPVTQPACPQPATK